jgi:hypothetical protein
MPLQIVTVKTKHRDSLEVGDVVELFFGPPLTGSGYAAYNVYTVAAATEELFKNVFESKKLPWREEEVEGTYEYQIYVSNQWVTITNAPRINILPTAQDVIDMEDPTTKTNDLRKIFERITTYRYEEVV